jgi:hypothetical protein
MENPAQSSRALFLRRLGMTLAAGLGALAIPATAKATFGKCCLDNTRCSGVCPSGKYWHYCDCAPYYDSYCVCATATSCYSAPC